MANHFFSSYFGLGIVVAIVLAFIFPYTAVSLHPYATLFLFFLMFLSGFAVDWSKLKNFHVYIKEVIIGNLFLFTVIPLVVYFFARFLLTDSLYIYGIMFAALCPTAIVAPFFTGILKGDKELAFFMLVSSSLLAPFVIPPVLHLLAGEHAAISTALLFKEMILFVPLPLFCAFLIKRYYITAGGFFTKSLPVLNFILLALLIFILFGVSMTKLHFSSMHAQELGILFLIALIQDFGFLLFLGPLARSLHDSEKAIALFNAASMKNIAIASTILLLYAPKAAIAPAVGFLVHAILFTPFILRRLLAISLKD